MWQKLIVVYNPLIAELILKYRCVRFQKIAYFIGVYTSGTGLSAFVPFSRTIFSRRRLNKKNETGVILSIDKRKIFLYNVSHLSHETVLRHSFEQTKNIFGEQLTYENCTDYIKYSGHNIYAVVPVPDFVYRGGYLCP